MRISAKADYAIRAATELARAPDHLMAAQSLAQAAEVPYRFLEGILSDLRREGLIVSRRGAQGGHQLARAPEVITLAAVIRAVDGPLVFVRDKRPGRAGDRAGASALEHVWVALRANVRTVLEHVTLADLANGHLPTVVADLTADDDAWRTL